MVIYFIWWAFIPFYFLTSTKTATPVCDFSPLAIIFISAFLGLIYSITFIIKAIIAREPNRTDYLIFLAIITLPLIFAGLYLASNA